MKDTIGQWLLSPEVVPWLLIAVLVLTLTGILVTWLRNGAEADRLRSELDRLRGDLMDSGRQGRQDLGQRVESQERTFLAQFGQLLQQFSGLRDSQDQAAARLRDNVDQKLVNTLTALTQIKSELSAALSGGQRAAQERDDALRSALVEQLGLVIGRVDAMRQSNSEALAQMRASVEEKLQQGLTERVNASFKTIEDQFAVLHKELGTMGEVAQGVEQLRHVLSNVKLRGTFGEAQLATVMSEILLPEQYEANVNIESSSGERVDFAVRLPGREEGREVLLPIDAKFPLEDYYRLVEASAGNDAKVVEESVKALRRRILEEAKSIRQKYVAPPRTTEFAVLYLPIESLWAEVLRMPGLFEEVQRKERVIVAGPTVLAALLNSLQVGFRTLTLQRRSAEVWRLLEKVRVEFTRFTEQIEKAEKSASRTAEVIADLQRRGVRVTRQLKRIEPDDEGEAEAEAEAEAEEAEALPAAPEEPSETERP